MGFHRLHAMWFYFSTKENFHVERVTKVFTIKRFLKLFRLLHLNNNENIPQPQTPNFDRLYKLGPLLDPLTNVFHTDIWQWTKVCALKHYMPVKPIKRGFKIWALACASTGYLLNIQIYQGKVESTSNQMLGGERVVLQLSERCQNRGYCLYFDNLFTTIPLMQKLLDRGLFGCETIGQNRKAFTKQLLCSDKDHLQHHSDSVTVADISVYKWKYRGVKCVTLASNRHNY